MTDLEQIGVVREVHAEDLGELHVSVHLLEPCGRPSCRCASEAHHAIFWSEPGTDRWLGSSTSYTPDEDIDDTDLDLCQRLIVLLGVPFRACEIYPLVVISRQHLARNLLPARFEATDELAGLRRLRAVLNENDPLAIIALLREMNAYAESRH